MQRHLVAMDFDGTIANTFADSPQGMNVNVATGIAVRRVLGNDGFAVYQDQGGMMNREPGEMVRDIQRGLGHGVDLYDDTAQKFIDAKLDLLVPEISTHWPLLLPGAKDFLDLVAEGDLPIDIAIVSSGHDRFIRQVFEVNGLPRPDILVTSDILRSRSQPNRERYKPHTYQLAEAHRQWEERGYRGFVEYPSTDSYLDRGHAKDRMVYIGDDPVKDGELARNARIPYVYVPFTKPGFEPDREAAQLGVQDFDELADLLVGQKVAMLSGESFAKLMFGRDDRELFPSVLEGDRPYNRWQAEQQMNSGRKEAF